MPPECRTCGKTLFRRYWDLTRGYFGVYGYYGSKQCKRCWYKTNPNGGHDYVNTSTITDMKPSEIKAIDKEVLAMHNAESEMLKIKDKQTCGLFRCLICWHYIFADDSIISFNDGYVHKACT